MDSFIPIPIFSSRKEQARTLIGRGIEPGYMYRVEGGETSIPKTWPRHLISSKRSL